MNRRSAASGSGKSFLTNYITHNQSENNGIVRLIDIGPSYQKMTKMLEAQFIDFTDDANICINPFSGITDHNNTMMPIEKGKSKLR